MAKVLVFIDNPGAALKKSSLELLTIARSLGETVAAVNGELHDDAASTLAAYGAQALYRPSATDLDDYLVGPKAAFLAAVTTPGVDTFETLSITGSTPSPLVRWRSVRGRR